MRDIFLVPRTTSGFISLPTMLIPIESASTTTVPIPQHGSIARTPSGFGTAIFATDLATRVLRDVE